MFVSVFRFVWWCMCGVLCSDYIRVSEWCGLIRLFGGVVLSRVSNVSWVCLLVLFCMLMFSIVRLVAVVVLWYRFCIVMR